MSRLRTAAAALLRLFSRRPGRGGKLRAAPPSPQCARPVDMANAVTRVVLRCEEAEESSRLGNAPGAPLRVPALLANCSEDSRRLGGGEEEGLRARSEPGCALYL